MTDPIVSMDVLDPETGAKQLGVFRFQRESIDGAAPLDWIITLNGKPFMEASHVRLLRYAAERLEAHRETLDQ